MKKYLAPSFLLITLFLFTSCSSKNINQTLRSQKSYYNKAEFKNINISQALIKHYKQWYGVKYKYGGNTKSGIDCSYFVQNAIFTSFAKKIPRTTLYQSKYGIKISQNQLQTGDLVFFHTNKRNTRHVGIYLDFGDFMHVSTSRGVMISNLSNVYWKKHYWKARRILIK